MGWSSNEEEKITKKGVESSSKILLAIIACLAFVIVLIVALLFVLENNTTSLTIDGLLKENYNTNILIDREDNIIYVNIEEFAKLVNYAYHKGEYKGFTREDDKCYVQGEKETATFFLNDNKVYKLPVDELTSDYIQFEVKNTIREINGKMYAPIDAINIAFNVIVTEKDNSIMIQTLNELVKAYDKGVKKLGYTGITDQSFENQKSLLYGYLIVKKDGGLYKIIERDTGREVVLDKYNSIEFTEETKEFFVTNSLNQVGIIKLDGTIKIEPIYDSIAVLDKSGDLYLVQKDKKYGVVKSGDTTIIYPEYDSIGLDTKDLKYSIDNHYLILDTLIPVCKDKKWGAYDKKGNLVYKTEYDGFGCNLETIEIDGVKKTVEPILSIKECNGIVVEKNKKYGLFDINAKNLVSISLSAIYKTEEDYMMLYKNKELNVIEQLIKAGLIENVTSDEKSDESIKGNDKIENNTITVDVNNSIVNQIGNNVISNSNNIANQIENNVISNTTNNIVE